MKRLLLAFLLLIAAASRANPNYEEPVGQRLGMSLIDVIDSLHKEGVYSYAFYDTGKSEPGSISVFFYDNSKSRILGYDFVDGKCQLGILSLPIEDLGPVADRYGKQFPSIGTQAWQGPHCRIVLKVYSGTQSLRNDHKPHIMLYFDKDKGK